MPIENEQQAVVRAWHLLSNQQLTTNQVLVRLAAAFPGLTDAEYEELVQRGAQTQFQTARLQEARNAETLQSLFGEGRSATQDVIIDTPIGVKESDGSQGYRNIRVTLPPGATVGDYFNELNRLIDSTIRGKYKLEVTGIEPAQLML